MDLYQAITSDYPYETRSATSGQIRQDETLKKSSFKYRARQAYNKVPVHVRTGSLSTVKKKLKHWVRTNIPID